VASTRAPDRSPIVQTASNLPSRSARQAYDYVLSEGSPEYYEEFIRLYPHDPLSDRIRVLLGNLLVASAWHKAVQANSPVVYKSFYDNYGSSPYAKSALILQAKPKAVPLMQFSHLAKSPMYKPANMGFSPKLGISKGSLGAHASLPTPSKIITLPAKGGINPGNGGNMGNVGKGPLGKITTLPGKIATGNNAPTGKVTTFPGKINTRPTNLGTNKGGAGKVTTFPGKINANPMRVQSRPMGNPRHFGGSFGGGHSSPRFATQSRSSFGGGGGFGGGGFGGGGFRR
jgi:hypothetical protein